MSILIIAAVIGIAIFTVLLLIPSKQEPVPDYLDPKHIRDDLFTPRNPTTPDVVNELFDYIDEQEKEKNQIPDVVQDIFNYADKQKDMK